MDSLNTVFNNLVDRVTAHCGLMPPRPIGDGRTQTFKFMDRGKAIYLLAVRDVARIEDYQSEHTLWVEGLDLVLDEYHRLLSDGIPPSALPGGSALVIHAKADQLVSVGFSHLLKLHGKRIKHMGTGARFTFVLRRLKVGYMLEGVYGAPEIPVPTLPSLDSLAADICVARTQPPSPWLTSAA